MAACGLAASTASVRGLPGYRTYCEQLSTERRRPSHLLSLMLQRQRQALETSTDRGRTYSDDGERVGRRPGQPDPLIEKTRIPRIFSTVGTTLQAALSMLDPSMHPSNVTSLEFTQPPGLSV